MARRFHLSVISLQGSGFLPTIIALITTIGAEEHESAQKRGIKAAEIEHMASSFNKTQFEQAIRFVTSARPQEEQDKETKTP
ncbi:hypothetical protein GY21_17885 [Cryobacterium roopkundense]|uniref:Uncharacterized protein n=1 Tax=Cryobacterium roopkundense TaxID=1001240 RepID=A0A099J0X4_9MICO|nr:hypothetical protein [Cryobacterium roopkundense]KGJ72069.1 hypothetical protein GY21_17885 [Cryobacterium roopkundense]MBB5643541.1 hypothetical protein [Cryobacterium roopkundense]